MREWDFAAYCVVHMTCGSGQSKGLSECGGGGPRRASQKAALAKFAQDSIPEHACGVAASKSAVNQSTTFEKD